MRPRRPSRTTPVEERPPSIHLVNDPVRGTSDKTRHISRERTGDQNACCPPDEDRTIADWDGLDRIDLTQLNAIVDFADLTANHLSQSSGDTIINAGGGNTIRLTGVTASNLTAEDFLF